MAVVVCAAALEKRFELRALYVFQVGLFGLVIVAILHSDWWPWRVEERFSRSFLRCARWPVPPRRVDNPRAIEEPEPRGVSCAENFSGHSFPSIKRRGSHRGRRRFFPAML